jgi:hypothetical protein
MSSELYVATDSIFEQVETGMNGTFRYTAARSFNNNISPSSSNILKIKTRSRRFVSFAIQLRTSESELWCCAVPDQQSGWMQPSRLGTVSFPI